MVKRTSSTSAKPDTKPRLVFLATGTGDKVRDLNYICQQKKIPMYFFNVEMLVGAFHQVAEERGQRKGNAKDKLDSIARRIANPQTREVILNKIEDVCNAYDLPFDPKNIFLGSEDGGVTINDPELWEKLDKSGIPQNVLDLIDKNARRTGPASETANVLSALGGGQNFMHRTHKAKKQKIKTNRHVELYDENTVTLLPISELLPHEELPAPKNGHDPNEKLNKILEETTESRTSLIDHNYFHNKLIHADGRTVNILFEPKTPLDIKKDFITNYHYARLKKGDPKNAISCGELGPKYVSDHSGRSELIKTLADKLKIKSGSYKPLMVDPAYQVTDFSIGLLPHTVAPKSDVLQARASGFVEGVLSGEEGQAMRPLDMHYLNLYSQDTPAIASLASHTSKAHSILGNIGMIIEKSDGFLFLPDERTGILPEEKFEKYWNFFSVMVAKQVEPRDKVKPFVVINHNGCHDELIANHRYLANFGLSKDHSHKWAEGLEDIDDQLKKLGVTVLTTAYFDLLNEDPQAKTRPSEADMMKAGLLVLEHRRKHYLRREHEPSDVKISTIDTNPHTDILKRKDCFKVAIFCSATNENTELNNNIADLSYILSKNGCDIIYGGGDRYTMGAALRGVVKHRDELYQQFQKEGDGEATAREKANKEAYIAGFSTRTLLTVETEKADFSPNVNYRKQCRDIYERVNDMLTHANTIVVGPGGNGTLQELVAPLMLKKLLPAKFKDKNIIVYNPKLFKRGDDHKIWDTALHSLLGKDYELMVSTDPARHDDREKAFEKWGVYIESDISKVAARVENSHEKWTTKIFGKNNEISAKPPHRSH